MTNPRIAWPAIGSIFNRTVSAQCTTPLDLCAPGLRYGPVPIKRDITDPRSKFDCLIARVFKRFEKRQYNEVKNSDWLNCMADRVKSLDALNPDQLAANRAGLAQKMRQEPEVDELFDEALAYAVVSAQKTLQLVPRPNQYLAARAMLQGHFVEMATGEGKTLSIALATGAIALSGTPVHVLTANNYLAERDASDLADFYQFMGLQVAHADSSQEPDQRRKSYKAHVVYVTAKQVAFDWLNDSLEMRSQSNALAARLSALTQTNSTTVYEPVLRGLCLAIVDEADSLLVDVSDKGRVALTELSRKVTHVWQSSRYREERVTQALMALHLFELDRDYIVRDGQLHLTDVHTGRSVSDRRLPHGLHTMLELKEKCSPTAQHETVLDWYQWYFA